MDVEFASVSEPERERAIGTLVLAFTADPFVRWIYPEASQYLSRFPESLQAVGGAAFSQGGVWRLGDFAAVALWLPPGIEPGGDANLALFQATVDSQKFNDLLGVFGQMEEAHPAMPHGYLPWFGVDCALQGQGLGSRLMTPCLDIVDRDHLPAYLDSTDPRNVPFYQRHGFEVTGQWQAGDSPRSPPCSGNPASRTYSPRRSLPPQATCRHWQARSWSHRPGSGFAEEYAELLGEQAEGGRLPGIAAHPNGTGSNLADRQRLLPGACRVRKPWTVFTHTSRAARVLCSERASSAFPPDVRQAAQVIAVKFPRIEL